MHDQYGNVVLGNITFSPSSGTSIDSSKIAGFTTKTTRVDFKKDLFYYTPFSISGAINILSANEADHRRLRRLQSHAFSEKALSAQEDIILSFTRQFIEQLRHRAETEKVKRRVATMTDRPDFLRYILKHTMIPKKSMNILPPFTQANIANSTQNDTCRAQRSKRCVHICRERNNDYSISGLTFHLLTSPGVLKTLCEEIRGTSQSPEQITMLSTAQLPYLHAVIEEALRIYPPAPNIFPRISPKGVAIVCGQFVPEGVS
ncbi:uncharacterized protein PAC_05261 [Phialocephala subalpina]|uniref:Benzoate 4-monooxygenase cytochrome P450 n=1 Tax=Phialocephala subalpina TaxID=576137 RepID=A0A1L7WRI1_9HELO|nr:uncharacterized protein PAC_05261 [Phialocephala subalpina]